MDAAAAALDPRELQSWKIAKLQSWKTKTDVKYNPPIQNTVSITNPIQIKSANKTNRFNLKTKRFSLPLLLNLVPPSHYNQPPTLKAFCFFRFGKLPKSFSHTFWRQNLNWTRKSLHGPLRGAIKKKILVFFDF